MIEIAGGIVLAMVFLALLPWVIGIGLVVVLFVGPTALAMWGVTALGCTTEQVNMVGVLVFLFTVAVCYKWNKEC